MCYAKQARLMLGPSGPSHPEPVSQQKPTLRGGFFYAHFSPTARSFSAVCCGSRLPWASPGSALPQRISREFTLLLLSTRFPARRARPLILGHRATKKVPGSLHCRATKPEQSKPGNGTFSQFHRLTQQNLCHFVAFIGFQKNHWPWSANERIRSASPWAPLRTK